MEYPVDVKVEYTNDKKASTGKKAKRKIVYPAPLPAEFDEAVYNAAVEFDESFDEAQTNGNGHGDKALIYGDRLLHHLDSFTPRWALINKYKGGYELSWPASLYIPGGADWRSHWFLKPPDKNRYALDWKSPEGYNIHSSYDGKLFSQQGIRTIDRYIKSEAGLGILFTPKRTLSVISLEPMINCSGHHRWYQMMDQPVAGFTLVKMSVILAAWQKIPGPSGWDLINHRVIPVMQAGPNSGSGYGAITPYQQSFTGKELATPFLVQAGHTYLLGIVVRVSIWSTLTDTYGKALPLIDGKYFRVWGSIDCTVPQIEVIEQQVHIP